MKRWQDGRVEVKPKPRGVSFVYREDDETFSIAVAQGDGEFTIRALRALTGEVERAMEEGLV